MGDGSTPKGETPIIISRPWGVTAGDVFSAFMSGHGGPGSKALDEDAVGPSDQYQLMQRFRDKYNVQGLIKEQRYLVPDTGSADALGSAGASGIEMTAQGLQEWLNGCHKITVRYWQDGSQSGFYVPGMDPGLAKQLVTSWVDVDVTHR